MIILVFNITWAAPWGILVLYATDHLGMGPVGYGALTTASALGGLVGVGIFGALERRVSFATLMRVCLTLEVIMHLAFALTTVPAIAFVIMFGFGVYAFVWATISTTVRQRLVPLTLQGRIASVNMVGVFAGLVIGQALGGVIAQTWGLTAPWWFAFGGSALTLLLVWRSISSIAAANPCSTTRSFLRRTHLPEDEFRPRNPRDPSSPQHPTRQHPTSAGAVDPPLLDALHEVATELVEAVRPGPAISRRAARRKSSSTLTHSLSHTSSGSRSRSSSSAIRAA
jgi:MFS family permease